MPYSLLVILLLPPLVLSNGDKRCPVPFGEAECPLYHFCKNGGCYASMVQLQPTSFCNNVLCRTGTACRQGMCYPIEALKCNRNILIGDNEAHSITTTCGRQGKCVNGQCRLDRCMGVWCPDGQLCSNGKCVQVAGKACFGHADCGPTMECWNGVCSLATVAPVCNCNPMEICRQGYCLPNPRCSTVRCGPGYFCLHGECVPAVGMTCGMESCHGGTVCVNGQCQIDNCLGKCPDNHMCRVGECRLLDGLPCISECPFPYVCIDGHCVNDGCAGKVCKIGYACELGHCTKITDRFCFNAMRDCAYGFTCDAHKCVDQFKAEKGKEEEENDQGSAVETSITQ